MSCIFKFEENGEEKYILLTKGADSVIESLLTKESIASQEY